MGRSKSSASGYRDRGAESSDDGRPKSSRSGKHRPSRISISDIEAARAAGGAHREVEGGVVSQFDQDMEDIKESHRRHRRTSSDGGKRQKRSRSSPRTSSRTTSTVSKHDLELSPVITPEPVPSGHTSRASRHSEAEPISSGRSSRGSRQSEDYSSVEGYATIKRRPKNRKSAPRVSDVDFSDVDSFRRSSVRSGASEEELVRLDVERSSSRNSERSTGRRTGEDSNSRSKRMFKAFLNHVAFYSTNIFEISMSDVFN